MIVVSNSSPLIGLSAINQLDILRLLYQTVYIPDEVFNEIVTQGEGRAGTIDVKSATWIDQMAVDLDKVNQLIAETNLDKGEAEAIILAKELNADLLIIDDIRARIYATIQSQPIIGILGVLLAAKNLQIVLEVKPLIDDLLKAGYWISPQLYKSVLQSAGE